jgi:hypothetical protein
MVPVAEPAWALVPVWAPGPVRAPVLEPALVPVSERGSPSVRGPSVKVQRCRTSPSRVLRRQEKPSKAMHVVSPSF